MRTMVGGEVRVESGAGTRWKGAMAGETIVTEQ